MVRIMKKLQNWKNGFTMLNGIIDDFDNLEFVFSFQSNQKPNIESTSDKTAYKLIIEYNEDNTQDFKINPAFVKPCGNQASVGINYRVFQIAVPSVIEARWIRVIKKDKVIYERQLDHPPKVQDLKFKKEKERYQASWKVNSDQNISTTISLILDNGRPIPIGHNDAKNQVDFNLEGLPEGGKGYLEVKVTDGVLSTNAKSNSITLDSSPPIITMISPTDKEIFKASQIIALRANCHNALGDLLDWKKSGISWKIDGEKLDVNKSSLLVSDLIPGNYLIEVKSKVWGKLASSQIKVLEPDADEIRHDQLFKRLVESR